MLFGSLIRGGFHQVLQGLGARGRGLGVNRGDKKYVEGDVRLCGKCPDTDITYIKEEIPLPSSLTTTGVSILSSVFVFSGNENEKWV